MWAGLSESTTRQLLLRASEDWNVYHKDLAATEYMQLNNNGGKTSSNGALRWNRTRPTASVFSVGTHASINGSSDTYIAYLFATVDGVSKVGSYTMVSGGTDVDCGFSNGSRFIFIKSMSTGRDWCVLDSTRGIVAGNDPYIPLNTTDAEITSQDVIDPLSSGFRVPQSGNGTFGNVGETYIFYAIAA